MIHALPDTSPGGAEQSDAALVCAMRRGDRLAFGVLYTRHARLVHGVLLARVPIADVNDLVHDVFLAAFERIHALREGAAFPAWLCAIARNRAIDHLRRSPMTVAIAEEDLAAEKTTSLEAIAVLRIIHTLPEAYRETLVLRLVEGMTGPEIAERTGLTAASVRVNLHRGFALLREKYGGAEQATEAKKGDGTR
jgi:RNA polymerase sigma-70 factor (ECF subfamily)